MNVNLIYASTEGQTIKIAQFVERRLKENGHTVKRKSADGLPSLFVLEPADLHIIAASMHAGSFQRSIVEFAGRNAQVLNKAFSVFLSVSLSAAGDAQDVAEAEERVNRFRLQTGWSPKLIEHVAGAFRYTRYDYFKRLALKYIAYRKGQSTDTSRDWELTDWARLRDFVDRIAPPAGSHQESAERQRSI